MFGNDSFNKFFDLNHDGHMDPLERGFQWSVISGAIEEEEERDVSGFDDDLDVDFDDEFDDDDDEISFSDAVDIALDENPYVDHYAEYENGWFFIDSTEMDSISNPGFAVSKEDGEIFYGILARDFLEGGIIDEGDL